jgi:hypothetical protein
VAGADLGQGTRLAAATGAWICFEDESGQALQPPKARTWGRRGRTPVVRVSGRISVAGLACVKAGQPGRFFYRMAGHRLRPGTRRAMNEADYAALITAAHRYLNAPVIVILDNLKNNLGNLAAGTTDQLAAAMRHQLDRIQRQHGLITGFLGQTGLTLDLQPP